MEKLIKRILLARGMRNPLESLDELILAQYEKVNQAALKHLGMDKYDLFKASYSLGGIAASASGVYSTLAYYVSDPKPSHVIGGVSLVGLGYAMHYTGTWIANRLRTREFGTLQRTGASPIPWKSWIRPVLLSQGVGFVGAGTLSLRYPQPAPETIISNPEQYVFIANLSNTLLGIILISTVSGLYFLSTTMPPPSKKKNVFATMYDTVTGFFRPKPELQPAKEIVMPRTIEEVL